MRAPRLAIAVRAALLEAQLLELGFEVVGDGAFELATGSLAALVRIGREEREVALDVVGQRFAILIDQLKTLKTKKSDW